MLRGIHKASGSWLGKGVMALVMGLLVVSFAIWGIGDIFRGFGRSTVAKIGGTEITIEQFRNYYTDKMTQLSRRIGRPINTEQARALGLDRQLIGQLVAETTLDEKARELRLGVSDAEMARRVTGDPTFAGVNGQFDRSRFEQMIRQAGFTEPRYIQEQRQLTIRRQIAFSITGDLKPPTTTLSVIDRFQNEKRNAEIVTLGAAQAGDIAKPNPATLTKYFEERKVLFRAPETRKVVLLSLSPTTQARWETVSDADAKAYYEQRKADYGTPERRQLRQIVFAKPEEATAAAERIVKGLSFDDLVKERGLFAGDTDLGMVTKSAVIDPAVADAAFALADGAVSGPVKGRFGTILVQVTKIEPATQKSYEDVAAQIKQTLAETRARAQIGGLRDKVEDERAGGSNLAEAAKKLGLDVRTIEAIDRSGRDANGQPVADPPSPDLISNIFSTDVGIESDLQQLPGGGYLWFDVAGISPSRDRTFDEVKDQVEKRWQDDEIATRLKAKADDMVAKLKAGTPIAQVAEENRLKAETVKDLQRGKAGGAVSSSALDAIFRSAKGAAGAADGATPASRIVFVVTDVIEPKLDPASADSKKMIDTLRNSYSDAVIGEYVAKLESEMGVTINQSALQQVIGGGDTAN